MNRIKIKKDRDITLNKLTIDKRNTVGESVMGTRVYLNGHELHGVIATNIDISVESASTFTIKLIGEVEIINRPDLESENMP